MKLTVILATLLLAAHTVWGATYPDNLRTGDIIFQTSRSSQSIAVQRATGSPYSHCGVIFIRNGKPYVYEAISTVSYTPLERWIARGNGSRFVVKRLKDADNRLTPAALQKFREVARSFQGRPYDLTFEWSDRRIYCSELVWKLYDRALGIRVGEMQKLKEFRLNDPVVAGKLKERYGSAIPLNEPVISPDAVFRSGRLVLVAER